MSIIRPAIRACAVAALKDKTWAQDRVFDSDMTALAEAVLGNEPQPYICVYTDTDDRPNNIGTELYDGDQRVLSLVIEIGVANAIQGANNNLVLQFAATDQGMELAVDIVSHQVTAALFGDPQSQWGEIFKKLCWRLLRVPSRRGGQASGGIRFAARRITYMMNTIYDIPPGVVPADDHPLMQFINLAKDNPIFGVTDVGSILQSMLSPTAAPDWRIAQAYLGLTKRSAEAMQVPGLPLPFPEIEEPPLDYSDKANEYPPPMTNLTINPSDPIASNVNLNPIPEDDPSAD